MNLIYIIFLFLTIFFLSVGLFYPIFTKKNLLETFQTNRDTYCKLCCMSNRNNKKCREICIYGTVCNCC